MYKKIRNPQTNRDVSIYSNKGKQVLKLYLQLLEGGKPKPVLGEPPAAIAPGVFERRRNAIGYGESLEDRTLEMLKDGDLQYDETGKAMFVPTSDDEADAMMAEARAAGLLDPDRHAQLETQRADVQGHPDEEEVLRVLTDFFAEWPPATVERSWMKKYSPYQLAIRMVNLFKEANVEISISGIKDYFDNFPEEVINSGVVQERTPSGTYLRTVGPLALGALLPRDLPVYIDAYINTPARPWNYRHRGLPSEYDWEQLRIGRNPDPMPQGQL